MQVRLVSKTEGYKGTEFEGKSIDEMIVGLARVSSSREINEMFEEPEKLLRHCLFHGHWSIFAECNLTFEIKTSRAMGRELLRHDLRPQELSQRYAEISEFEPIELRKQSTNNRQSSSEVLDAGSDGWSWCETAIMNSEDAYRFLLEQGVARECARMVLPETTQTTLYLNGTIRTWLSVLNSRLHNTAQKEIRLIAEEIKKWFMKECPIISAMMFNFEDAEECHIFDRLILEKYGIYEQVKENNYKKPKVKKK
jgi:thymidylate synthase (FAD)